MDSGIFPLCLSQHIYIYIYFIQWNRCSVKQCSDAVCRGGENFTRLCVICRSIRQGEEAGGYSPVGPPPEYKFSNQTAFLPLSVTWQRGAAAEAWSLNLGEHFICWLGLVFFTLINSLLRIFEGFSSGWRYFENVRVVSLLCSSFLVSTMVFFLITCA